MKIVGECKTKCVSFEILFSTYTLLFLHPTETILQLFNLVIRLSFALYDLDQVLSSWIVLFHGLMMTPAISGTIERDANNLSIFRQEGGFYASAAF